MNKRIIAKLFLVVYLFSILLVYNMVLTSAENLPNQTETTTTESPLSSSTSESMVSEIIVAEPSGEGIASIVVVVFLLLLSPILALAFLFLGVNSSSSGVASGFEGLTLVPALLLVGVVYLIYQRRNKS